MTEKITLFQTRIARYFTENKTTRWIDILADFTNNINNSKNRSIGMAPSKVTIENAPKIFKKLHPNQKRPKVCKLKVGDIVRRKLDGNVFTKVNFKHNCEKITTFISGLPKTMV